jgi:tetratricopeptide (TPR) repeat protein
VTRERYQEGATEPPDPHGVRTVEELVGRLRQLRTWSGLSYRAVHREVVRLRAARDVPEQPVYNTVYRCFQVDRIRLDVDLVVDIARVILGDQSAPAWRHACRVVSGFGGADVVEVVDRVPADADGFVGRTAALRELWDGPGVTLIVGMAGIGKTRLAYRAAHRIRADIRLVVDLRGFDPARPPVDPAAVLDGFLRCLGATGDQIGLLDEVQRSRKYRELLAGKRAVVVLDNAASAEQVRSLLPGSPTCSTLITSRRALDVPGARLLSLPTFSVADVMDFLRSEQVDVDETAALEIGELVAYLPLALTLVTARIKASPEWTVADHLDRLRHQRSTMRLDNAVEAAISLSYESLPGDLRRTFLLLAQHVGDDFCVTAAAATADLDVSTAQQRLDQLVSDQLLQQPAPGRYGFHDLVRRYAIERATDELPPRARRAAVTRLLDNYVSACARAITYVEPAAEVPEVPEPGTDIPEFTGIRSAVAWLRAEQANLLAAAIYADENNRSDITRMLSRLLGRYLRENDNFDAAQNLHTRALRTAEDADRSRELSRLGAITARQGRWADAVGWFDMALAVARELDDPVQEHRALTGLGNCYWWLDRYADALDRHQQALAIAHRLDDQSVEGRTLGNLGAVYERLGRYADAVSMFERNLQIARELADYGDQAYAATNLAVMFIRLGRLDEAREYSQQTIALSREIGNRRLEINGLSCFAELSGEFGQFDVALDYARRALSLSRELGDQEDEGGQLAVLGVIYRRQQQYDESLRALRQALDLMIQVGRPLLEIGVRNSIGQTLFQAGSPAEAIDYHRRALTAAESANSPYQRARAHHGLGNALSATGDKASAESHWRTALRIYSELDLPEAAGIRAQLRVDEQAASP